MKNKTIATLLLIITLVFTPYTITLASNDIQVEPVGVEYTHIFEGKVINIQRVPTNDPYVDKALATIELSSYQKHDGYAPSTMTISYSVSNGEISGSFVMIDPAVKLEVGKAYSVTAQRLNDDRIIPWYVQEIKNDEVVETITNEMTILAMPNSGNNGQEDEYWSSEIRGFKAERDYRILYWYGFDMPIKYYINTQVPSGWRSAIQSSFQTWESASNGKIDFSYYGTTSSSPILEDGKNVVGVFYESGGPLAKAYITSKGNHHIKEFDICINTYYTWATDGSLLAFDVQNVMTHEVGHTLFLNDLYEIYNSEQTMFWGSNIGETTKRTLEGGDLDGLKYLYPPYMQAKFTDYWVPQPCGYDGHEWDILSAGSHSSHSIGTDSTNGIKIGLCPSGSGQAVYGLVSERSKTLPSTTRINVQLTKLSGNYEYEALWEISPTYTTSQDPYFLNNYVRVLLDQDGYPMIQKRIDGGDVVNVWISSSGGYTYSDWVIILRPSGGYINNVEFYLDTGSGFSLVYSSSSMGLHFTSGYFYLFQSQHSTNYYQISSKYFLLASGRTSSIIDLGNPLSYSSGGDGGTHYERVFTSHDYRGKICLFAYGSPTPSSAWAFIKQAFTPVNSITNPTIKLVIHQKGGDYIDITGGDVKLYGRILLWDGDTLLADTNWVQLHYNSNIGDYYVDLVNQMTLTYSGTLSAGNQYEVEVGILGTASWWDGIDRYYSGEPDSTRFIWLNAGIYAS